MRTFALLFLISFPFFAAEPAKKAPEVPAIPAEARAAFWRAIAEQQDAGTRLTKAQDAMKAAEGALRAACGGEHVLTMDKAGEPACEAKPPAAAPKK